MGVHAPDSPCSFRPREGKRNVLVPVSNTNYWVAEGDSMSQALCAIPSSTSYRFVALSERGSRLHVYGNDSLFTKH